jgi:serine/threonine-protein kinase
VFGRYVLFDRIGRGGMADIFLARADTAFGGSRLCVLKQILPQLSHDVKFERALISEAKLAAQLTHANVVQVFDLGREGDRLFIGMEYVEGFDLNQLLRALSKAKLGLPAEFGIFIIREVLRALDYAHRAKGPDGQPLGLVHRDVSPSNVLVSFEGEVKLCDFGIARAFSAQQSGDASVTLPRVVGKSAYMSPEHARGESIDARADVFAAGILLWELCAGRRLYRGNEKQMLGQAKKGEIPPLPERGLPHHGELQAILDRALSPSAEARFQSAQEFLRALEDYAVAGKLMVSQLRFGSFLIDHFGERILELRRGRELAARNVASELPPPVHLSEVPPSIETPTAVEEVAEVEARDAALPLESAEALVGWTEPGVAPAVGVATSPTNPPSLALALPGSALSDLELSHSLRGLELADPPPEPAAPPAAAPVSAPPMLQHARAPATQRDWIWYAAAIAILALGVFGYLWRCARASTREMRRAACGARPCARAQARISGCSVR